MPSRTSATQRTSVKMRDMFSLKGKNKEEKQEESGMETRIKKKTAFKFMKLSWRAVPLLKFFSKAVPGYKII